MAELQYFWQITVAGLGTGLIYGLIGIGFAIVLNVSGIINLAQGEFSMLGAIMTLYALQVLGLPIFAAIALAVTVVTILGVAFERLCISRLKVFSIQTAIFITLGASMFARGGAMVAWGKENHSLPAFSGHGAVSILGAAVPLQVFWILGIAAAVIAALYWWFNRTLFGLAMRSCAENRLGAEFVGINVRLMVTVSFAMSAALGALAGIVAAPLTFVSFDGGLILGIKGFVAAILGGRGSYLGPVIGGLALGVLESVSAGYISSTYKDSIAFAVLILILTLRPNGLFGRWAAR
ncbi:MAG: branched-chain amino acid ABC transporter permease [Anaerolineales bacterium]|nr:branched-chain amino acid ABC transporter permease [Alphaproteobacteria bacterium]MCW5886785.1 branched-chain amino acid ABC transporter permease [Anaerolineales bacterium]